MPIASGHNVTPPPRRLERVGLLERWLVRAGHHRRVLSAAILALALCSACVKVDQPTDTGDPVVSVPASPSAPTLPASPATPAPAVETVLAYNPDIKLLLASDCVICHGPSRADGGYRASTYAEVMTRVAPGNASSRLVALTQSNGSMYRYWSGNSATRQSKAASVRSWVVTYGAKENR